MLFSPVFDMFFVYRQIKRVNPNYVLVYNNVKKRYEIRDFSALNSLVCIIPYDVVDSRVYDYLLFTRRENLDRIIALTNKNC